MKKIILTILILTFIIVVGCTPPTNQQESDIISEPQLITKSAITPDNSPESEDIENKETELTRDLPETEWKDIQLKDVNSGNTFKISDFSGKKILVENFAVWCPKCTQQQKIIKKLHDEIPSIISVSLNTDPNEDETLVKNHAESYGFNWIFAISPKELTQRLIDEFGIGVVSAPSVPVILICENQSSRFLPSGDKPVEKLKSELEKGC